ncbi:MAG: thioesterase domain-containing protein, partial [Gammaproteobacteria bacterium]|nr:thioesterase domain-containing protein [Gammaproteobacteria bacterium]
SIQELPVTANGKIDRSAFPKLDRRRPKLSTPYVAARGVLHQRLVELWCDVLELDQVGIRDDFFDLGGDSLLAVQMAAGLEILTEQHVPPDLLLGKATIEYLADVLLQNQDFGAAPEIFNAGGNQQTLFFLHGDYLSGGYYTRELARYLGPDRPVAAIRSCGLAGEPIPSSYKEMAEIHLEQIRAIQPTGPYLLGGACNGGLIAFEISQLLAQQGETVARLVMVDASASNLKFQRLRQNLALRALSVVSPKHADQTFLYALALINLMEKHQGHGRLRLVFGRLTRKVRSLFHQWSPDRDDVSIIPEYQSVAGYWANLRQSYQRIDRLYFPAPYEGPVVLLWPQERPNESLSDVRFWWEQTCSRIEFHEIQGDGITCLTRHVDTLAQALEAALIE